MRVTPEQRASGQQESETDISASSVSPACLANHIRGTGRPKEHQQAKTAEKCAKQTRAIQYSRCVSEDRQQREACPERNTESDRNSDRFTSGWCLHKIPCRTKMALREHKFKCKHYREITRHHLILNLHSKQALRPRSLLNAYGSTARSLLMRSPNAVPNVACFFKSPRYGSTNGPVLSKTKRSPQPINPNSRINSFVAAPIGTM